MRQFACILLVLCAYHCEVSAGEKKMPLPAAVLAAKRIYIDNQTPDCPECGDHAYQELSSWGRYEMVSDPKDADLIFVLTSTSEMRPIAVNSNTNATGPGSAQTNGTVVSREDYTVYLAVVDPKTKQQLYRNGAYWRFLWSKPTKTLIKDLRKRIEEQERATKK